METIYPVIRRKIIATKRYQEEKALFLKKMAYQPVGLCQQQPSAQDSAWIVSGKYEEFLESGSTYAVYLIRLTALEDAAFELKASTGCAGYTDVCYLPVPPKAFDREALLSGFQLLNGKTAYEARKNCQSLYGLAEPYELETMVEEEINELVEKAAFRKVFVAGKLETAPGLAG